MCDPLSIIGGGTAIIGGIMGKKANDKQAKEQKQASQQDYARTQAAIAKYNASDPFAALGARGGAVQSQVESLLGVNGQDPTEMLQDTPGYQFQFKEGMDALQTSLGAQNSLYSGKAMKEVMRYGQNFANNTYQQALTNRMGILTGASNAAVNTANMETGGSAALASGQIAAAQTKADGTQSLISGIGGVGKAIAGGLGNMAAGGPKVSQAINTGPGPANASKVDLSKNPVMKQWGAAA